jgi:predicted transcriptional regulator
MSVLWELGSASVQQVSERLSTVLAYTTVMTTLDRLFKKGVLQRQKKDRAFIYSAIVTAREVEGQRAAGLIRRFFSDSSERPDILLSCLVDAVHHYDTDLLQQLETKIRAARAAHLASGLERGERS